MREVGVRGGRRAKDGSAGHGPVPRDAGKAARPFRKGPRTPALRQPSDAWTGRRRRAPAGFLLWISLAVLGGATLGAMPPALRVRTPQDIQKTLESSPHDGLCDKCHSMHSADAIPEQHALIGPNDNALCDQCHTEAWKGGSYAGTWLYAGSSHGTSTDMVWPGPNPPARFEPGAAGKCLNCHDPHGLDDGAGVIPGLKVAREEALCLACHSGHPAASNVQADLQKAFHHPVTEYSGRHKGASESSPGDFGVTPVNNRHSECEDCHNPHVARHDGNSIPGMETAPRVLLGVSRVSVQNGSAGTPPAFTFIPGSDTLSGPPAEYQTCFKCHSSWTIQPNGQSDLAMQLNPNNPSFHPVESQGADLTLNLASFAGGMGPSSQISCDDCHGSDFGSVRGPHGSSYPHILKKAYQASSTSHDMTSDELCFSCHSYDTYANPSAPQMVRAYSRFSSPGAAMGHAEHVGAQHVPCYACHVTHGSTDQKHLVATGRMPGILTFTESPTGGTCTPSCHAPQTYTVTYAR